MKKLFAALLAGLCVASMAITAAAAGATNQEYSIPKANTAPVIDGVITGDEWDNAFKSVLNKDTTTTPSNTGLVCPEGTFYWMWDEAGMYLFAEAVDTTESSVVHGRSDGAFNSGDGFQFQLFTQEADSSTAASYFWSLVICDDGSPIVGEHFTVNGSGAEVPEVEVACTEDGDYYAIEAFFPAEVWQINNVVDMKAGQVVYMGNVIMECDENGTQDLFIDSAWMNAAEYNIYTFTEDVAGHVDAPEVVEDAPQTFDAGVIAAVAAIVSAAGYAISKKR